MRFFSDISKTSDGVVASSSLLTIETKPLCQLDLHGKPMVKPVYPPPGHGPVEPAQEPDEGVNIYPWIEEGILIQKRGAEVKHPQHRCPVLGEPGIVHRATKVEAHPILQPLRNLKTVADCKLEQLRAGEGGIDM